MPNLNDINVKIKGDNNDLRKKMRESQAMAGEMAQKYSDVGRSIVSGIAEPLAKANIKNKEFQDTMLQGAGNLDRFIQISEAGVLVYNKFTPQLAKAVSLFKALNLAQKATVIGAVVAGVAGAVALYRELNAVMSVNTDLNKEVRSANTEARKSIIDTQVELSMLKDRYFSVNTSLEERRSIILKLKEMAPDYFGKLNEEGSTYNSVRDAINDYTAALLQNAKAKAAQDKIVELTKQQLDLEEEMYKAKNKSNKLQAQGGLNPIQGIRALWMQNVTLEKQKKEYDELGRAIQKLTVIYRENAPEVQFSTKTTTEKTKKLKEQKKEFEGIQDPIMDYFALASKINAEHKSKTIDIYDQVNRRLEANLELYKQDGNAKKLSSNGASFLASKIRELIKLGIDPESQAIKELTEQYRILTEVRGAPAGLDPVYKDKASDPGAKIMQLRPRIDRKPVEAFFHFYQKEVLIATQSMDILSQAASQASGIMDNVYDRKEQRIESIYSKEIRMIEASKLSEEQKAQRIMAIEERKDQAMRKIQREQAIRNRNLALFQATINTAAGVTQALAQSNIAGAIAAGIYGGLQIAAIASEPIPALAKGGLATGETMAIVGDNPNSFVDPEVIKPVSELDKYLSDREVNLNLTGGVEISNYKMKMFLEPADVSRKRLTA